MNDSFGIEVDKKSNSLKFRWKESRRKDRRRLVYANPLLMFKLALIGYEESIHPAELLLCCAAQGIRPFVYVN